MLFDWYDQDKKVQDEVRRHYSDREYGIVSMGSFGLKAMEDCSET